MIPPPFQNRFVGDSGIDVATQEIDVLFPDGERRRVVLRIGAPFQKDGDDCVRSELENLDRTDGPLSGSGTFHALVLGIAFILGRLEVFEQKHGCRYFWPGSHIEFNYRKFFSIPK